ncbi:hypothetical protein Pla175_17710 [Pirellulimonas nuda]|uniref:Uncharacterized protein n=1 Tax=Pirellulimonas nuda TaxID=2528009 RepID=A0A518DA83_9BACT|nr:hypothetical protein Pla175_17710 [Pirellulimonas nuda]
MIEHIVNLHNIGVLNACEFASFVHGIRVSSHAKQTLYRHFTVQRLIFGFPDFAKTSGPEFLQESKTAIQDDVLF